jgi:hypothetical protein
MADPTDLEERVAELERHVQRLRLLLGGAAEMLVMVREPLDGREGQ